MLYRSTRGETGTGFADVLLGGLAPDGGLYVPETLPRLPRLPERYADAAAGVMRPFVEPDPLAGDLEELSRAAYGGFRHDEVAPLRPMGNDRYLLELFWGPTLSFKDLALQLVGVLLDGVVRRRRERVIVLGATSGDTGSAAIAGCRGLPGLDVVVLFPEGRVSEVQRRQMTTVPDANVHVVGVDGTFDDCQRLVKAAFAAWDGDRRLTAFNSINWARIAAQAAYYAFTAQGLGDAVRFVVPTGNFGNVLSAHLARRLGAPISRLTIANNANHGIADLVETGTMELRPVAPTHAPAMDVQIPSNLERYLFEALGNDPERVVDLQARLADTGRLTLPPEAHARLRADFAAAWRPDTDIVATIGRLHDDTGVIVDPHTAVAWSVATEPSDERPTVVVATADPAKFPEVVRQATGQTPSLPPELAASLSGPERMTRIPTEAAALTALLEVVAGNSGPSDREIP